MALSRLAAASARPGGMLLHVGFDWISIVEVSSRWAYIAASRERTLRSQRAAVYHCLVSQNHPVGFYEVQFYGFRP